MKFTKKYIFIFIIYLFNVTSLYSAENIVFLDIDYVLNNSNLGKSIYTELENINKENITKLNKKEKLIKEKQDNINKIKNVTAKEKLEKDIILFNKEVEQYKIEKKKILDDFKLKKNKELDNFLIKINPIIQEYMKSNSIDIILEKNQIFVGNKNKDITNEIIDLINKNL
tara:strand:- start:120 stop:629 length:510 start_codon:yes stop_codon:yes gene_type:complete